MTRGLLAVLGAVAFLAGCGARPDTQPGEGATTATVPVASTTAPAALPVTVRDALGRQVTVSDNARIVALNGGLAEIVVALGLGDRLVGRDISATIDEVADVPIVTRAHDVSPESVLSLHPTVVLADSTTGPPEALEQLRAVGVPVVVLAAATSLEQIGPRIEAVATALGITDVGREVAQQTTAAILEATPPSEPNARPTVAFLYLRGQAGVYLLGGPGSGADAMIEAAGGVDAGRSLRLDKPFTPITSESLVAAAPDVLLLTTTGLESVGGVDGLLQIPGVGQTPAGRSRRIATVEDGLLLGFGVRTPLAVRQLAAQLAAEAAP